MTGHGMALDIGHWICNMQHSITVVLLLHRVEYNWNDEVYGHMHGHVHSLN